MQKHEIQPTIFIYVLTAPAWFVIRHLPFLAGILRFPMTITHFVHLARRTDAFTSNDSFCLDGFEHLN